MRKELELIQLIEKYLNNELSANDKAAFEERINRNPELKQEVEKQQLIQEAVTNVALKGKIQKAWKSYRLGKFGSLGGIVALTIIAATAATLWYSNQTPAQYAENIKYALNESGEEIWADADELVPAQFFTVNADEDNVLQTEGGLVVAIPKGALLQNGKPVTGNIEIEIKEALTPEDIILSGLSTKSGDQLLETGGMFYFNARKDGENLDIDKENGIIVDVPTDDYKAGMQLYDGIRKEDGSIDWQSPKPLETFLTTVDVEILDFYPPNYESKLAEMGEGDNTKPWKDSLYYSFANQEAPYLYETRADSILELDWEKALNHYQINPAKIKTIWNKQFNNTLLATKEFEERLSYIFQTCNDDILDLYVNNLDKRLSAIDSMVVEKLCDGKTAPIATIPLNQDSTHSMLLSQATQQMENITDDVRQPGGEALFKANCASCHKPNKNTTGPMLAGVRKNWINAGEGENIYEFVKDPAGLINSGNSPYAIMAAEFSPTDMTPQGALTNEEIDAIFDYADGTQEERAAAKKEPSLCSVFQNFALQNKGRVKDADKAAQILSEYYAKQSKANAKALSKTQQDYWKKYDKLNQDLAHMSSDQQQKEIERIADNFRKECDLNMEEACKQLGIKKKIKWITVPSDRYTATVITPGWKNIDRAVIESVANRETLDYSYKGKKAVIKYESCEVEVTNVKDFERVMVYLIPRELNSFMRMPEFNNGFKENLNELIKYQLVAVGMKDNEVYYAKLDEALTQNYTLTLEKTTKKQLRKLLRKGNVKSVRNDVLDDVKFQLNAMRMNKEKTVFEDMARFRNELQQAIFPCAVFEGVEILPME